MPTNYIDGIPVEFPHSAYPCQITFMQNVLQALKNRENALLESPTGTGKTLSLLCAALAWRTAEMGRKQLNRQTSQTKSANYDVIMERNSNAAPSGFKCIDSASGSTARLQSVLNESLRYQSNDADLGADVDSNEYLKPPLIIYASRTHSQLAQVIGELRRTTYRPKIAIVGSRDQMCIHPNVKELTSSSAQSAVCTRLTRKKACEFNVRVPEALNHLKREQDRQMESCGESKIMDMEDVINFASAHKACPYYTSRELLHEADLVFMPYNYLLDKKTRGSSLLSFRDAIVIFDEAHNVESSCYDAVSCEISSDDLSLSERELAHCLELVDSAFFDMSLSARDGVSKDTIIAAQRFISTLKTNSAKFTIPSNSGGGANFISQPGDAIFKVFEEGQQVNPESGRVEVDEMLTSFEEIVKLYLEDQYNRRSGKRSAFQSIVSALRTIYGMAEEKDSNEDEEKEASTDAFKHSSMEKLEKRRELIQKSREYYRMVVSESGPSLPSGKPNSMATVNASAVPKTRTIAYWCFNPGVVMKDLIGMGVRSIILTSGTLSPMKSFMQEMQIEFKHVLENDHVIDDEQVFAAVVGTGPSGKSLNSSFEQRDSKEYQQELGLTIVNFCRVVPDGVLVFFPSYQVMDSCMNYWQMCRPGGTQQTIFQMIQAIKAPVIEPKNKGELTSAMEKYERIIDDPKESRGSIFFAVCRGKVSEGLDFADAKGRAVIVTGIPYPPFKDPKIILKKQYLQDLQKSNSDFLSGAEWYNQQASRAVNQALGRVIRHRKDFGAILLCDERFRNPKTIGQLSKWLRGRVVTSNSFGEIQGSLARFFKDKPKHVKAAKELNVQLNRPVSHNNASNPSNSRNDHLMQKFKLDQVTAQFSSNSTGLMEMFKNKTAGPESISTSTRKFDWFNSTSSSSTTKESSAQPQPSATKINGNVDAEKQKRARDYLEFAKKTLPADVYRNFMGLLKTYRAGQIEIEALLKDFVDLLKKVPERERARELLEGFEAFIPSKHRSCFEKVLSESKQLQNEREEEEGSEIKDENENEEESLDLDLDKKRKLHPDLMGKRPISSIEPVILKRKLIEGFTSEPTNNSNSGIMKSSSLTTNSKGAFEDSVEKCPICKDVLNGACKAKCGHVACFECWEAWLGRTLECPLCRQRTRLSQLKNLSVDENKKLLNK